MTRSVFAALVVGVLVGLGAQFATAQPVNGCPNPNMTCNGIKSTTVNATTGNFGFVDAGSILATGTIRSSVGSGSHALAITTEGARVGCGPDTYFKESGTVCESSGAVTIAGVLTSSNDINLTTTTTGLHNNSGLIQFKAAAGQTYLTLGASGSGDNAYQGGTINAGFFNTAVGNVGASGPDDLQTYTITANTLNNGTRGLRVTTWGTCSSSVNAKTFTLNFGSQVVLTHACTVSVASQWRIVSHISRTGASAQDWESVYTGNSGAVNAFEYDPEIGTATQTETATIVVKMQTTVSTSNNDIVQEGMTIEYL